ncbi:MAG: hypothetical protein PHH42_02245, partial [Bacteroidales bacterium]|nr:hypothetical protein [Bacteroidales bacterium]
LLSDPHLPTRTPDAQDGGAINPNTETKYRNHRENRGKTERTENKSIFFLCVLCAFSASSAVNFISD